MIENEEQREPLSMDGHTNGREQTDPLNAHQTTIFCWKGFWILPSNLSESVCCWLQQIALLKSRINNNWMIQGALHNNHLNN